MDAADRLAKRLEQSFGTAPSTAEVIARFIYEVYLPEQIIGMKEAAERMGLFHRDTGLPNSNALTMRLARGAEIDLAVQIAGTRVTTLDAIDAYAEIHPAVRPVAHNDSHKEAS